MKNMTLKEIAVACGGIYYGDDESYYKEVSSVVIDSRKVEKKTVCLSPFAVQEWMDTCSSRRRSGTALCVRSPKTD